jgi:hypothetical protein
MSLHYCATEEQKAEVIANDSGARKRGASKSTEERLSRQVVSHFGVLGIFRPRTTIITKTLVIFGLQGDIAPKN